MKYYKYTLTKDERFDALTTIGIQFENEWIKISNEEFVIKKGYSWDGCSPKFVVRNCVIGTWDGSTMDNGQQQCYRPSLIHDALYQFLDDIMPQGYTRKEADEEFLYELSMNNFALKYVYYGAVRLFGGLFRKFY